MTLRRSAFKALAAGAVATTGTLAIARMRARQAERMFPPSGTFVDVDGVPVHYLRAGSGPEVVLIHGASGNMRDFTFRFFQRLAERYTVTAFDRPGMGYTGRRPPYRDTRRPLGEPPVEQAALLRDAASRLGIERPIVAGHSFGGIVALGWAVGDLDTPGASAASAVVSFAGVALPWPGRLGWYYTVNGSDLGPLTIPVLSAYVPAKMVRDRIATTFHPQEAPEGYEAHIGARLVLRPASFAANVSQVNGLRPHVVEMERRYADLDLPIELVHGTEDGTVPIDVHARPFAVRYGASLAELPGVGHMPHHVDPEACMAAIDRAARRAR